MCGEKSTPSMRLESTRGSPPRMRGKVAQQSVSTIQQGITPAYAGKSDSRKGEKGEKRDHPRVCGEKFTGVILMDNGEGSPPRMRGKAYLPGGPRRSRWITPAYARKRMFFTPRAPGFRDHPRVCGEKASCQAWRRSGGGSPPRMRGKGYFGRGSARRCGITPAYAGKRPLPGC